MSNLPARFEGLESRQLLSASAATAALAAATEKFNLMSLFGYSRSGSSWKYRTTGTAQSDQSSSTSTIAVSNKVSVATRRKTFDGHPSNQVSLGAAIGGVSQSTAWANDSTGTFVTGETISYRGSTLTATVHDLHIAPRSMTAGKKYQDSGTFTGSFKTRELGSLTTGELDGSCIASSKIFGHETITVRGKKYDAIKGVYSITLNGSAKFNVAVGKVSIPLKVVESQTFWAVNGVGIVRADSQYNAQASPPTQSTVFATAKVRSDLISSVLA